MARRAAAARAGPPGQPPGGDLLDRARGRRLAPSCSSGQVAWFWLDDSHRGLRILALLVTVLVAAGHLVVMPRWRYRVHRWEVSPLAVYTQAGWLTQERRIAPLSRIQTVDSQRGPLEQLFGLTNVTVTTASAAGPLHIKGLDDATAQRLVHELTTVTAAAEGDAT